MKTNSQASFFERNAVTLKIISIAILALILLIPNSMVQSVIHERENRRQEAIEDISAKWGLQQTVTGPVLNIPYYKEYRNSNDKLVKSKQYFHILPSELDISGQVSPEERHRSIYEAVVYSSDLNIKGQFQIPESADFPQDNVTILWAEAYLSIGLSDIRGLKDEVIVDWSREKRVFEAGVPDTDLFNSGLHAKTPLLEDSLGLGRKHSFDMNLRFNGSSKLHFTPIGKSTTVQLKSPWPNPSFDGAYIPDANSVSDSGFDAHWKVLHLNRNYPQWWSNSKHSVRESAFGVSILLPVDVYQKSIRSSKYAILFIGVTFLLFFFIEILNKKLVHPIQYTLVGIALVVFYSLLISLSEHINFDLAYLIASLAVVLQISLYSLSILKQKKLSAIIGSVLGLLYFYIYILLQLQGYALLMGSVGLFILVAFTMYLSRNVNWHELGQKKGEGKPMEEGLDV
ncbi:MAG TPA: cell envelope integrity protein CreD [Flavobacteriales bacterium]|nr:cell envelope integrity protein CreD [Flavobacteriales bacterium]